MLEKEDLAKPTNTAYRPRGHPGTFKELLGVLKVFENHQKG